MRVLAPANGVIGGGEISWEDLVHPTLEFIVVYNVRRTCVVSGVGIISYPLCEPWGDRGRGGGSMSMTFVDNDEPSAPSLPFRVLDGVGMVR